MTKGRKGLALSPSLKWHSNIEEKIRKQDLWTLEQRLFQEQGSTWWKAWARKKTWPEWRKEGKGKCGRKWGWDGEKAQNLTAYESTVDLPMWWSTLSAWQHLEIPWGESLARLYRKPQLTVSNAVPTQGVLNWIIPWGERVLLIYTENPSSLWGTPFLHKRSWTDKSEEQSPSSNQALFSTEKVWLLFSLLVTVNVIWLADWSSCLDFPTWWTGSWNWKRKWTPFSSKLVFARLFLSQQQKQYYHNRQWDRKTSEGCDQEDDGRTLFQKDHLPIGWRKNYQDRAEKQLAKVCQSPRQEGMGFVDWSAHNERVKRGHPPYVV